VSSVRVELAELAIGDVPERWEALGFDVGVSGASGASGARYADVGGVRLSLGAAGRGIVGWAIRGIEDTIVEIDGLPTIASRAAVSGPPDGSSAPARVEHPNGGLAIDHVVVITPDFDRTAAALEHADMPLRRVRDAGGFRQGFRRLGPAILELVEAPHAPDGPARFWGLVVIVEDLEALAERLGDHLGPPRDAVQPNRHIATLRESAGLGLAVAFMDPGP
jgi:hypothetical protein